MGDEQPAGPAAIGWIDLTVADAPRERDFHAEVVGWNTEPVEMERYCVIEDPAGAVAALVEAAREAS